MLLRSNVSKFALLFAICAIAPGVQAEPSSELAETSSVEPVDALTMETAITWALANNPELATFPWALRAADARILQAGLRPNPELAVEIEELSLGNGPLERAESQGLSVSPPYGGSLPNLAWNRERESGGRDFLDEAELTLSISQVFERGGKRKHRRAVAQAEKTVVQWDYEVARTNIAAGVAQAFLDVMAAQEEVALQIELEELAQEVARTINTRVAAGKVSPLEGTRADIALETTTLDLDMARSHLATAQARLCAWWAGSTDDFKHVVGQLDAITELPTKAALEEDIQANPDLARWAAEIAQREAILNLEMSQRRVDPTVTLGLRTSGVDSSGSRSFGVDTGGTFGISRDHRSLDRERSNSILLGLSVPLPLFNRNQGNIAEAAALVSQGAAEERQTRAQITGDLNALWEASDGAYRALDRLQNGVMPRAQETFEKTQRGYTEGKFSFLDVLDAQRTLFDTRTKYLGYLVDFHRGRILLERLTGRSLPSDDAVETTSTMDAEPAEEPTHE